MTENEKLQKAIEEEKELYEIMKDRYEKLGVESCKDRAEEHGLNIKWLEEIQQYRAIGTIEEFKALKVENEELHCEIQAINATMELLENEIRAKAIDEFMKKVKPIIDEKNKRMD